MDVNIYAVNAGAKNVFFLLKGQLIQVNTRFNQMICLPIADIPLHTVILQIGKCFFQENARATGNISHTDVQNLGGSFSFTHFGKRFIDHILNDFRWCRNNRPILTIFLLTKPNGIVFKQH